MRNDQGSQLLLGKRLAQGAAAFGKVIAHK
jgi:hypothetical protein